MAQPVYWLGYGQSETGFETCQGQRFLRSPKLTEWFWNPPNIHSRNIEDFPGVKRSGREDRPQTSEYKHSVMPTNIGRKLFNLETAQCCIKLRGLSPRANYNAVLLQ